AFGDDLKAVLESRPVAARRADAWYRTVKFVRRHWLPLAAAVAVILSLTIGLYVSRREQALAQRRFSQLRNFSNRVLTLDEEIQGLPGSTKVREKIVALSLQYLDGLQREAQSDADLKLELANGYASTARVQGVPSGANLGKYSEALESLSKGA